MRQIADLLKEITKIDKVCKRRSDPKFKDFNRYVADMSYIVNCLKEISSDHIAKMKILDIGAGAGAFSIALANRGFNVTAHNLAEDELSEIRFFKQYGCKFIPTDLNNQKLPFSNKEFDVILCLHVIEHLERPLMVLNEFRRVLIPGGLLILATPNGAITNFYKNLPSNLVSQGNDHVKEYTANELANMVIYSGFTVRGVYYSNEMVAASLLDMAGFKRLLVQCYCFFCSLIPTLSYEIHMNAKAENL